MGRQSLRVDQFGRGVKSHEHYPSFITTTALYSVVFHGQKPKLVNKATIFGENRYNHKKMRFFINYCGKLYNYVPVWLNLPH
jgi:hypothetical protein